MTPCKSIPPWTRRPSVVAYSTPSRHDHPVRFVKDWIVELLTIPLVQTALHMAYVRNYIPAATKQYSRRDHVKSAVYAASLLPLLHHCSTDDAKIVYDNLGLGELSQTQSHVDFRSVKASLERNYDCLGIKCSNVGGVWDQGEYGHYASPCVPDKHSHANSNGHGTMMSYVVGIFIFTLIVLVMIFALSFKRKRRKIPSVISIDSTNPRFVDRSSHGFPC